MLQAVGQFLFAAPVLLVGLLAAAIPVVLHLLARVRAPEQPFPSLRFLRQTVQKTARRRRVQSILLLILRSALLAAMVLAAAQPIVRSASQAGSLEGHSVVVVVDTSLSTSARPPGQTGQETRLAYGVDQLRGLLGSSNGPSEVAILATNGPMAREAGAWVRGPGPIAAALSGLEAGIGEQDLAGGLARARLLLERRSAGHTPAVLIVSDRQPGSVAQLEQALPGLLEIPELRVLCLDMLGSPVQPPVRNVSIEHAGFETAPLMAGTRGRLVATVVNHSVSAQQVRVGVESDGQRLAALEQAVQLAGAGRPGSSARLSFPMALESAGPLTGRVLLVDFEDGLAADNQRAFAVDVLERRRVLLVTADEAAGGPMHAGHPAFFVQTALRVMRFVSLQQLAAGELDAESLEQADVLFLVDAGGLTEAQRSAVDRWVLGGGRLAVFPGARTSVSDLAGWASRGGSSLAARPSSVVARDPSSPASLSFADVQHPLLAGLYDGVAPLAGIVCQTSIELGALPGSRMVLGVGAGSALLVERSVGAGSSMLFGVAADAAGSTLPTHPVFPALLARIVLGSAAQPASLDFSEGQTVRLALPPGSAPGDRVEVRRPGSRGLPETVLAAERRAGQAWFSQTYAAGVYRWTSGPDTPASGAFAVNVAAGAESDLSARPYERVLAAGGSLPLVVGGSALDLEEQLAAASKPSRWIDHVVALAILLLVAEVALGNRRASAAGSGAGPARGPVRPVEVVRAGAVGAA